MHRRRRIGALLLLAGLLALPLAAATPAHPVRALSCVEIDVVSELARADFAFVGHVVGQAGGLLPDQSKRVVFEVEQWVKGDLGSPVAVHGFVWSDPRPGERMGMIVRAVGGVLRMDDCVHVHPDMLLAIAALADEVESEGPAAILVGGEFGESRLLALDALGRVVGFGLGEGQLQAISICPGGQRAVEVSHDWHDGGLPLVTVRDLATLTMADQYALVPREDGTGWPESVFCRDEDATDVLVLQAGVGITHLASGDLLHAGPWAGAVFAADVAVVRQREPVPEGEIETFDLVLVDLVSGEQTVLRPAGEPAEPTELLSAAISPDGRHLAIVEQEFFIDRRNGMHLHLYDLEAQALIGSRQVPAPRDCDGCAGEALWINDVALLVRTQGWDEATEDLASTVTIVSVPDLDLVDEWSGGRGTTSRVGGGLLLGIDHVEGSYRLVATPLAGGDRVEVRTIPGSIVTTLAVLPSFDAAAGNLLIAGPGIQPSPTPAAPTATATPQPETDGPSGTAADPVGWWAVALLAVLAVGLLAGAVGFMARRRWSQGRQ